MHFNTLLDGVDNRSNSGPLSIPQNWSQGRTAFGGLLTAMIVRAMSAEVDDKRLLRFITISFVNPVTPGDGFIIDVNKLQEGRTVTQMEGRAVQGDKTIAVVQSGFGLPRESSIHIDSAEAPVVPPPEDGTGLMYIPGISPQFLQNFDLRQVLGDLPFTGSKNSRVGGWMRFKGGLDLFTDAHLIALIDVWPVGVLPMLRAPAPMSTLSWNVQLTHPYDVAPDEWLFYQATVRHTRAGYAASEASVWNEAGSLVAFSNHVVTVYDTPGKRWVVHPRPSMGHIPWISQWITVVSVSRDDVRIALWDRRCLVLWPPGLAVGQGLCRLIRPAPSKEDYHFSKWCRFRFSGQKQLQHERT